MAIRKYRVIAGAHRLDDDEGQPIYYGPGSENGDIIELDEDVAAKFQNKFSEVGNPVVVPPPPAPRVPAAPKAAAPAPAPAVKQ